ncbi:MAG: 1-(5-phosphoribosyl)-5-[(5-phosphoribosylamino)methylideneamino]imidazole-4-carboxamide isomerase [Bacteroidetes bacterium]|nr:MAG: 1-(5-phosphoribosyl)-5-[(5-phosphoribosylamino)methylideneamino]imidazole-4-carboxamide isomerase [Bacteroidota bacterium]
MNIIPAIDLIEGKCVRLTRGDYSSQKIYRENPVEVAKEFENQGITHLHLVDLDGAKSGRIVNHRVLKDIATATRLTIDFGGGIKRDEDVKIAFESGARCITGGTVAVKNPDRFLGWLETWGADRIILGADVRDGKIAVNGWLEKSDFDLFDFLKYYLDRGIQRVICTDISRDGCLSGSAIDLYKKIISSFPAIKLVASGGITTIEELDQLRAVGCAGAIVGKALYEGRIALDDIRRKAAEWANNA